MYPKLFDVVWRVIRVCSQFACRTGSVTLKWRNCTERVIWTQIKETNWRVFEKPSSVFTFSDLCHIFFLKKGEKKKKRKKLWTQLPDFKYIYIYYGICSAGCDMTWLIEMHGRVTQVNILNTSRYGARFWKSTNFPPTEIAHFNAL